MLAVYPFTFFFLWRMSQWRRTVTLSSRRPSVSKTSEESFFRKELQVFYMLSLLFCCFLVCWGPGLVVNVRLTEVLAAIWHLLQYCISWLQLVPSKSRSPLLRTLSFWMAYVMSGLNQFLFNIGNQDVRMAVKRLFLATKKNFKRRSSVGTSSVSKGTKGTTWWTKYAVSVQSRKNNKLPSTQRANAYFS